MISLLSLLNNTSSSYIKLADKHSNSPSQSQNEFPFKLITLSGMDIYSNERHAANAIFPILFTLFGISMLDSKLHPAKAHSPISFTLLGILILVKFKQSKNALSHIISVVFFIE